MQGPIEPPSKRKSTREDDEKLLHLVKLMPTQWKTITMIVGKMPSQYSERHEACAKDEKQMVRRRRHFHAQRTVNKASPFDNFFNAAMVFPTADL